LVVSEGRFSEMAIGEILPLQIPFSATFFVSEGLLFDPRFLLAEPLMVLGIISGVLLTIKLHATGFTCESSVTVAVRSLLPA
jgi:CPA2 family monovalent cation:H+ antiporter-2